MRGSVRNGVLGAGMCFVALAGTTVAHEGSRTFVAAVSGEVHTWKPSMVPPTPKTAMTAGMKLCGRGDEVVTNKGSSVTIMLNGVDPMKLGEEGRLTLVDMDIDQPSGKRTALLDLAVGDVFTHVQHLDPNSKFEVRSPVCTTGVRGTSFAFSAHEGSCTLIVEDGIANFSRGNWSVDVKAGSWGAFDAQGKFSQGELTDEMRRQFRTKLQAVLEESKDARTHVNETKP